MPSKQDLNLVQDYVKQYMDWLEKNYPSLSQDQQVSIASQMTQSLILLRLENSLERIDSTLTITFGERFSELRSAISDIADVMEDQK